MTVFNRLSQLNISCKTSVALGNFDGIHSGHRKIMEDGLLYAKENGLKSLCFTFSNHPFNFILKREDTDPDAVKLICSEEDKIRLIEEMGFDILVNIPFDEEIMTMSSGDFFKNIVLDKLNAGCVSVGFNYSYGARAGGNADTLRDECRQAGIDINVHDPVMIDGKVVSSTLIRELIAAGDMESVKKHLGRALEFRGTVKHGNRIGSSEGYPTANIAPDKSRMLPPNGVYFTRISIDGHMYNGVSNLGVKPTIADNNSFKPNGPAEKSIESYIFNFEGDIYGSEIAVYFDHFSRREQKFGTREELFSQIAADCRHAIMYYDK